MKTIFGFLIAMFLFTSCTIENCPSYGNTNKMTKYGNRAQQKYIRAGRGTTNPKSNVAYRNVAYH